MSKFTERLRASASDFGIDTEAAPHREPRQSKRPYFRWTEETHEETHAEPPITLDRVIFRAFDELVGRVDDFDRMAANWRCALTLMESYLRDQFGTIRSCPDTAKHFAAIAAILAQSEINA